jgi:hypothetical protein
MPIPMPQGRTSTLTLRATALFAAVLVATALGGWRAVSTAAPKPGPSTLLVNGVSYDVAHSEQVVGLSDSDLGGMSHGIQGLVTDEKALIKVSLVVSGGDSPTSYDAGVLRVFAAGSHAGIVPAGGTFAPGRLSSHGHIEGTVSFIVPRNGAQLTLRAVGDPHTIALLRVDKATQAGDTFGPSKTDTHPGAQHDMSTMPGMSHPPAGAAPAQKQH